LRIFSRGKKGGNMGGGDESRKLVHNLKKKKEVLSRLLRKLRKNAGPAPRTQEALKKRLVKDMHC